MNTLKPIKGVDVARLSFQIPYKLNLLLLKELYATKMCRMLFTSDSTIYPFGCHIFLLPFLLTLVRHCHTCCESQRGQERGDKAASCGGNQSTRIYCTVQIHASDIPTLLRRFIGYNVLLVNFHLKSKQHLLSSGNSSLCG